MKALQRSMTLLCRLRIAGTWSQRPELYRSTWYYSSEGKKKEMDHVLLDTCWRLVQNCSVIPSAVFAGNHQRFLVAILKIRHKTRRIVSSH